MKAFRHVVGALAALVVLGGLSPLSQAVTLDVKVLVISSGTAKEDQGLDLIDDMLNEIGVAYDVLDASRETLTESMLSEGSHGKYNGVILTDSMLYFTGPGNDFNSAFTLEEWLTLHKYERDFQVRESVLSGYPVSGLYYKVVYDLDYGMDMNSLISGSDFSGVWQAPAGGTEIFEYVNTQNALPVNDYAIAVAPLAGGTNPQVQTLLADGNSNRALISKLRYDDGREVLYSGITNAWYLLHSQVLNYEFLNFATKGLFLGSRKVYLSAHVDDLFLASAIWDPIKNETSSTQSYRNSSQDIDNLVIQQDALKASFRTLGEFKLDLAFNASGASIIPARQEKLAPNADAWLNSVNSTSRFGKVINGYVGVNSISVNQVVMSFPISAPLNPYATKAILSLKGGVSAISGKVCRVTAPWVEADVTWQKASALVNWPNRSGAAYNRNSCRPFTMSAGLASIDVTTLVNGWLSGRTPNYGLVILADKVNLIKLREAFWASNRPELTIDYAVTTADPLTAAIMEHKNQFRFLNHSFTHMDMYNSAGTTFDQASAEISKNMAAWLQLKLPDYRANQSVLVTGKHSGLDDDMGTVFDVTDDLPYPQGRNIRFIDAAKAQGVRYLASDSSRANQEVEAFVPGTDNTMVLLPRYPTSLFYNATTPAELVDEYNYLFYERFVDAGQNPCLIAGAICTPRSYSAILEAEANTTMRHMLTFKNWPHYFHISNLRDFENGRTLQFDWLNAVMAQYESMMALPVVNVSYYEVGTRTRQRLESRDASVKAVLDQSANTVTLSASRPIVLETTGLQSGSVYGGQYQAKLQVNQSEQTFTVEDGTSL